MVIKIPVKRPIRKDFLLQQHLWSVLQQEPSFDFWSVMASLLYWVGFLNKKSR